MSKSLTETAKAIFENANADTLKPNAPKGESLGSATTIAEIPKKPGEGSNQGQAAAQPLLLLHLSRRTLLSLLRVLRLQSQPSTSRKRKRLTRKTSISLRKN